MKYEELTQEPKVILFSTLRKKHSKSGFVYKAKQVREDIYNYYFSKGIHLEKRCVNKVYTDFCDWRGERKRLLQLVK